MRSLRCSWRLTVDDPAGFYGLWEPWPAIFTVWHNRLVMLPTLFHAEQMRRTAGLASKSRDGEAAARYIEHFGLQVIRGSSSKGGGAALVQMRRKLRENVSVILTPDGPRGPRYEVHPGATKLAEATGVPIIPLSANASRRWEFKGWDRTQIPKPFASVELLIGKPMYFDKPANDNESEENCRRLREAMMAITRDEGHE